MKDIRQKLLKLLKTGYCTPQIAQLAKKLKQPATTIHYNIKRLEQEGIIKAYGAVYDYKKAGMNHGTFLLINLGEEDYGDPEKIAEDLAKDENVESVDIVTGDYELIVKMRNKDIDDYYEKVKYLVNKYKFRKTLSLTSLKQIKTEFIEMEK